MKEENTVELIDLLRVIWKWKWFILVFTFASSVLAGAISLTLPKIYEVTMVIEPGIIDVGPDGKFIYIDSSVNIGSKIESQAFNSAIYRRMSADKRELNLTFKTTQIGNSNTVRVRLEIEDKDKGVQALSYLYNELTNGYKRYVASKKSEFDQKIAMNKRQLDAKSDERKSLEKEIAMVKNTNDTLIEEWSRLIRIGSDKVDKLSLLVYTNSIQQNIAHINDLSVKSSKLLAEIEEMKAEIGILEINKQSIENIKLIQPAQPSISPIKPKVMINAILAFVSGFIVSFILAFFLEYLKKMKDYS